MSDDKDAVGASRRPRLVLLCAVEVVGFSVVVVVPVLLLSGGETRARMASRTLVAWAASLELPALLLHITRALFRALTLRS